MRILIVEDDIQLNNGLRTALEKDGYAIDCIANGEKALRHLLVNHSNYDLVILDHMLPGISGVSLSTTLRKHEIFLPILMLTALTGTNHKVEALDAGADDYMTKPFSLDELSARVRALLRRPRETLKNELSVNGLTIHVNNKRVLYNNQELKLTLKEFGILEYLVRNPNQVITRDQILDHVWDFGTSTFSNIVDVHITNLRKKLEKVGAENLLQTIRGVGFIIKTS